MLININNILTELLDMIWSTPTVESNAAISRSISDVSSFSIYLNLYIIRVRALSV